MSSKGATGSRWSSVNTLHEVLTQPSCHSPAGPSCHSPAGPSCHSPVGRSSAPPGRVMMGHGTCGTIDASPNNRGQGGPMRIGVLTGGGDCPGLNAAIRAVVRKCEVGFEDEIVGFLDGWRGLVEDETMVLDVARCRGILPRGGTILGTSRTNPYKIEGGEAAVIA